MVELYEKSKEDQVEMSGKEIFEKVLKPKSGYCRGLGYGAKPNGSKSAMASLYERRIETEKEAREQLQNKVDTQQAKIDELVSNQEKLQALVNQLLASQSGQNTSTSSEWLVRILFYFFLIYLIGCLQLENHYIWYCSKVFVV